MTAGEIAAICDPGPYSYTIRGTDTDCWDRLHLFALFSYMQEAAYLNAQYLQIGSGLLDRRGLCWLLIRISVRLEFLPHWGETITVNTWSRGTRKLVFLRDFDFYDQNGHQFGSATSEWLIASQDSHRPQTPETVLPADHQPANNRAVFAGPAPRPPQLAEAATSVPVLVQYADFSDIDRNRHVNNTRYIAWCVDTVHAAARAARAARTAGPACAGLAEGSARPDLPDLPDLKITGLDIHYVSEVRLGAKIHLYCQGGGQDQAADYLVEARRADDGATVFRARVLTS